MKQETLEEAAENYSKEFDYAEDSDAYSDFIAGAKWQQERSYSEEEVLKAQEAILCNIKDALFNENYIIEYLKQFKKK